MGGRWGWHIKTTTRPQATTNLHWTVRSLMNNPAKLRYLWKTLFMQIRGGHNTLFSPKDNGLKIRVSNGRGKGVLNYGVLHNSWMCLELAFPHWSQRQLLRKMAFLKGSHCSNNPIVTGQFWPLCTRTMQCLCTYTGWGKKAEKT